MKTSYFVGIMLTVVILILAYEVHRLERKNEIYAGIIRNNCKGVFK